MSPKEYRAALAELGLAQSGASRFFQTNERTTRRWAADDGEQDVPRAVAITLRLMLRYKLTPADVIALMADEEERQRSEPDGPTAS